MKMRVRLALVGAMVLAAATPALAWKLVKVGDQIIVGKSSMVITAPTQWNRVTYGPIKGSEEWTLDGLTLNELYVAGDIASGKPLLYEFNKKDNPLPKFADTMQLTDLPDLVERTWRVARNAVVFKTTAVEPAKLGGNDAVRIRYEYVRDGSNLIYKGIATAAVVHGQLQLVLFEAPALFYFDRDSAKAVAVMDSVTFRVMPVAKPS
ncbi:hypothetical protein AQZ52_14510 [Novosphingobium fuchskuhlense]|uniref:Uncharacterized protein n=1 Tax=Novosphingobium fuchskuhlense TaxID=1117702 RepID=A0A117USK9_9SPHN|nr:hypothetical protein [Novosphingobium fuchskuhlense]KUR70079.1 hypothetical protein AQZ52_14510 [Novosphingobium fuchskuhlense]